MIFFELPDFLVWVVYTTAHTKILDEILYFSVSGTDDQQDKANQQHFITILRQLINSDEVRQNA